MGIGHCVSLFSTWGGCKPFGFFSFPEEEKGRETCLPACLPAYLLFLFVSFCVLVFV